MKDRLEEIKRKDNKRYQVVNLFNWFFVIVITGGLVYVILHFDQLISK